MKRYKIEMLEERVGDAQRMADALYLMFEVNVTDIVMGSNGNPLLLIQTPEDWRWERSFKMWIIERPGLMFETQQMIDPIVLEADETHGLTEEKYYLLRGVLHPEDVVKTKNKIDLHVMTLDAQGSAIHWTGTDMQRMLEDALEIYKLEKKPVFLRISLETPQGWVEHTVEFIDSKGEVSSLKR